MQGKLQHIPPVVKNTRGSDQWADPVDYGHRANWLAAADTGKEVDVVYFYPTAFTKASADAPDVSAIDDAGMRAQARHLFKLQATVFEADCNLYAPFYRQVSAAHALTLSPEETDELFRYSAAQDPARALDYYFAHYNQGRPFILAGHSQGAQILNMLLAHYMKEHPDCYKRMIAAYMPGYSVTAAHLNAHPHLRFAQGAADTGVIISYNTEGPGNRGQHNAVVRPGAMAINPLNWRRDEVWASADENKGALNLMGQLIPGFADARIDLSRGVVVCQSADPGAYAMAGPARALFGPESYHGFDYGFYYMNLRENVKTRIAAYLSAP